MKIFVRTDGRSFFIPVPNGLVSLVLHLSPKLARRAAESENDGKRADIETFASLSEPFRPRLC